MGAVNEDAILTVDAASGVLANDSDVDGNALKVTGILSGTSGTATAVNASGDTVLTNSYGTLTIRADGSYSFNANGADAQKLAAGQLANVVFTYTATDGTESRTSTLTITITGTNDAPVLQADVGAVNEDAILTVDAASGVLANDSDVDGNALKVTGILSGTSGTATAVNASGDTVLTNSYGTLTIRADGSYSFNANGADAQKLAAGQLANVVFTYTATDGTESRTSTLTITITGTNDAPVLQADVGAVNEDAILTVDAASGVLANDSDVDGNALKVTGILSGTSGTATAVNASGDTVLTNSYGTLTIRADGSYSFNANGADAQKLAAGQLANVVFTYTATDGTESRTSTLTITITGTNDAPVLQADVGAVNEDAILTVDAASGVLANDSDVDGNALKVTGILSGTSGTATAVNASGDTVLTNSYGTLTIRADGSYSFNANGADAQKLAAGQLANVVFTYTATDGTESRTSTLTITITGTNDAPVLQADVGAVNEDAILTVDAASGVLANDSDVDGNALKVTGILSGTSGTATAVNASGDTVLTNSYGTLTIRADGSYSFNANGADAQKLAAGQLANVVFTYTATDGTESRTSTLTITITGTNDAPVLQADVGAVNEDAILTVDAASGVLANDSDVDGNALKVTGILSGTSGTATAVNASGDTVLTNSYGTLTIRADGSYSFNANGADAQKLAAGQLANVVFTYTATDGTESRTSTLTITITGTNDAPVLQADVGAVNEDAILTVDAASGVLANDSDVDGNALKVTGILSGTSGTATAVNASGDTVLTNSYGTLTIRADGSYSFNANGADAQKLAAGQLANVVFTYTATDGTESRTSTLTITITGTNDAPVLQADVGAVNEDAILTVDAASGVLANDSDVDGNALKVTGILSGTSGTATAVNASGDTVLTNSYGTLTIRADGSYSFNANGADAQKLAAGQLANVVFTYTATDGTESRTSTLTITITGTNDAPVLQADVGAVNEDAILTVDAASGVLANDSDVDGNALKVTGILSGTSGTATAVNASGDTVLTNSYGTLTIRADGSYSFNANGADAQKLAAGQLANVVFTYTATDGTESRTSTLTITITGTNDAPVLQADVGAVNEDAILTVDAASGVLANDSDVDGNALKVTGILSGTSGTATAVNASGDTVLTNSYGTLTIRADGSYSFNANGADAQKLAAGQLANVVFTYTATDGTESRTSTLTITITGTNDAPVLQADVGAVNEDAILTVDAASGVLANDSDVDGNALKVTGILSGTSGTATAVNASGDTVLTNSYGTLTIRADGSYSFNANGADAQKLAAGQLANVVFTYTATDGTESRTSTLTITITGTNDAPVLQADVGAVNEDAILTVDAASGVLANDSDVDGNALKVTGILSGTSGTATAVNASGDTVLTNSYGTLTIRADGSYSFNANGADAQKLAAGQLANVVFTYTATDGTESRTSTLTITITGTNDAPVLQADVGAVNEDAILTVDAASGVLANDSDVDGNALKVTGILSGTSGTATAVNASGDTVLTNSYGTLTIRADGSYSFNANGADAQKLAAGQLANVVFTYTATDGTESRTSTLTITITGTNDAPVLQADVGAVNEDAILTVDAASGVLANDSDVDGNALKVTGILSGTSGTATAVNASGDTVLTNSYGTLTIRADGSYSFNANGADAQKLAAGQLANVVFTYTATDGTESRTSTLTITITGTNDAPVLQADVGAVNEDAILTVDAASGVLANDSDVDGNALKVTGILSGTSGTATAVNASGDTVLTNSYGTLTIRADGSYSFNANGADAQKLAAGQLANVVFTYTATDGTESRTSTLTITITGTNDAPVLQADVGAVNEDAILTVDAASGVLANDSDVDGNALKVTGILSGTSGTATAVNASGDTVLTNSYGTLTIRADGSYSFNANGADAQKLAAGQLANVVFTYTATDGTESRTSTLTITITGTNDAPVLQADVGAVNEDAILTVDAASGVLANDSDVDGNALKVTGILSGTSGTATAVNASGDTVLTNSYGTLTIRADGSYSFNANGADAQKLAAGQLANVVFTYTATDGTESRTSTLTITITGTNDAPVLQADVGAVNEDAILTVDAASGVLANDSDVDGNALKVTGILSGTSGTQCQWSGCAETGGRSAGERGVHLHRDRRHREPDQHPDHHHHRHQRCTGAAG